MKEIKHTARGGTDICIYEHTETQIIGSFFNDKDKPEVGDIINTAYEKPNYVVVKIIENRDACIHSDCRKNPNNAYFILEVDRVNPQRL